jgi:hypothetical protein
MDAVDVRHPGLPALFDETGPHAPMAFAVLERHVLGRAMADDQIAPKLAVIQTSEGVAILSREPTQAFVDEALIVLRADSTVGLMWPQEMGLRVPEQPAKRVDRLEFAPLDPATPALATWRLCLPANVHVHRMTAELLERCQWRDVVVHATGSVAAFLQTGTGVCLADGNEIVAEGYAPYAGRGSAEVGVVTSEDQRGRGYATIVAAFLAAALAERELAMYWSCDADNAASIRVAEKLGFQHPKSYALLMYPQLQPGLTNSDS